MPASVVTPEDINKLKIELLEAIQIMLERRNGPVSRKWLKSHDVRKLLNVSAGTLQNLRINGMLPFTKIGGVIFYDYDDISKMIDGNKAQGREK